MEPKRRSSVSHVALLFTQSSNTVIGGDAVEVEESPKKKFDTTQWITLVTLAFGNFCVGACVSLQAPFFPKEAEKKGVTATEYGLIFGVYELGVFLTAPIMGYLVSKLEPKFLMNSGIFVVGVSAICFGLLDYISDRDIFVGLAFTIRIAEAIGAAASQTSCFVIIAAAFPDKMATTFALLETFIGIGLIIGPTLGGALFDVGGYGLPFYVMGAMMLINAIVILFALPKPERHETQKSGNWLKFWLHPTTINYALVIFSSFNFIGFNSATLEPHLREFNLSGVYLGLLFALPGSLYALTAPFWGWLCDKKFNAKVICLIGCFITVASLLLIGPMPFLNLQRTLWIIIIALILKGISLGDKLVCAFSCSLTDTLDRGFPAELSTYGLVSSMFASAQSLGAFVGPSLGGYLLDTVGYDTGVFVVLMIELVVILFSSVYIIAAKCMNTEDNKKPIENGEKPMMKGGEKKIVAGDEKKPILLDADHPSYS